MKTINEIANYILQLKEQKHAEYIATNILKVDAIIKEHFKDVLIEDEEENEKTFKRFLDNEKSCFYYYNSNYKLKENEDVKLCFNFKDQEAYNNKPTAYIDINKKYEIYCNFENFPSSKTMNYEKKEILIKNDIKNLLKWYFENKEAIITSIERVIKKQKYKEATKEVLLSKGYIEGSKDNYYTHKKINNEIRVYAEYINIKFESYNLRFKDPKKAIKFVDGVAKLFNELKDN